MEPLRIIPTVNSLDISLDAKTGLLSFSGRSIPEDSATFFNPVMDWVQEYSAHPAALTECNFKLEYFNSAARKCIMEIFRTLEAISKGGRSVKIIWQFDENDDSMKETGEEYAELFKLKFEFISY